MRKQKISVVIGSQFGDEGKGSYTQWLCMNKPNSIVVRFNGGSQAGHTVKHNGIRHVCHSFASNVLLGGSTYWAEEFVVNPVSFANEFFDLCATGNKMLENVVVYSNPKVKITTPYDVSLNRAIETSLGSGKHGSVGVGFQQTLLRYEKYQMTPTLGMLADTSTQDAKIDKMLSNARSNYYQMCTKLNINKDIVVAFEPIDEMIIRFKHDLKKLCDFVVFKKYEFLKGFEHIVFEGAQGLMLDMDNVDYFPHLTPSKTGSYNVVRILNNMYNHEEIYVDLYYITRTYTTRHGSGRLDYELNSKPFSAIVDETNVHSQWQGEFRYSFLNHHNMMKHIFMDMDNVERHENVFSRDNIVITCVDQLDSVESFTFIDGEDGRVVVCPFNDYVKSKLQIFDNVILSSSEGVFDGSLVD